MVLLEFIVAVSLASLLVAGLLVRWIMARDPGSPKMMEIADAIRQGAEAYLGRQYRTISIIAVIFAIVFAIVIRDANNPWLGVETAGGFIIGALCSNLAGYIAMYISVRSNVRTANASMSGLDPALKIAFRGGMVFGLSVVAMSLIGIAGLFLFFSTVLRVPTENIPILMVGFGFGASFAALFAQLGGGIYTKAADMSADLVGKLEAGIPEDDPRNPAVVADLVGDNVGDIAGRGADLFESITGENIGAMILGAGLLVFAASIPGYNIFNWVMFPLVARAFGLIAAMIGMFFVYARGRQDPFKSLTRGLLVTAVIAMLGFLVLTIVLLGTPADPYANISLFFAALTGITAAVLITWITNHYTSYTKKPVLEIAKAAESGPAPDIATGIAVGMESTGLFVLVIAGAILVSFVLGAGLDALITPAAYPARVGLGIYATAIATMGMLSVTPFILAMDGFGPITDNAAGIVEMSGLPKEQREIGDLMDSAG
ncbi:MAG TPA: sodium/proton-translocating pyrophosphatase, partial [Candidatus Bathyarchaeia archaeon]